jgi:Xaa-Pro dipeptidase
VLFDIGARIEGYFGDITQQVFLGEPPDDYMRAYQVVHAAQEAAVRQTRAGATAHQVAAAASKIITESEFGAWNGPSTGHGIGVDIHEPPRVVEDNQTELRPGMVITVEPGVYIPGRFGIRIEDTVLVTDGEPRRLTRGSRPLYVKQSS